MVISLIHAKMIYRRRCSVRSFKCLQHSASKYRWDLNMSLFDWEACNFNHYCYLKPENKNFEFCSTCVVMRDKILLKSCISFWAFSYRYSLCVSLYVSSLTPFSFLPKQPWIYETQKSHLHLKKRRKKWLANLDNHLHHSFHFVSPVDTRMEQILCLIWVCQHIS